MNFSTFSAVALLLISHAAAGDIKLTGVGQVIGTSPTTLTGALTGVVVGSSFELSVEVFDNPTVLAPGARTYPIDGSVGTLSIGPATFSFLPPTEALSIVSTPFAGDQLAVPVELDAPGNLVSGLFLSDNSGMTLPTADLAQLVGMTFTNGPAGLISGINPSTGATNPAVIVQLSEIRIEDGGATGGGTGPYCTPAPSSSGQTGALLASGSFVAADNDLTLLASQLPINAFGFFITSQTQGFVVGPAGSAGNLCLGGAIGRYVGPGQIKNSGANGQFALTLDLTQTPTPNGLVPVTAGETWNFQAWFRDSAGGAPTSNFTQGFRVDFQ